MNKMLQGDCHVFNDKYIPRRNFAKKIYNHVDSPTVSYI